MLVDVSHVSDKTLFDTLEVAEAPLIASHSSCRALTEHPRNMTDDMLRAVAKNGGVVMVNFFSAFVDEDFRKALEALKPEEDKAIAAVNERYKDDPAARTKAWFAAEREIAARIPRPPQALFRAAGRSRTFRPAFAGRPLERAPGQDFQK